MTETVLCAQALEHELTWFEQVLHARLDHHLSPDARLFSLADFPLPKHDPDQPGLGSVLAHYQFSAAERLVLLLALVPQLRPQVLDVLLVRNEATGQALTEFGGQVTPRGFLPTIETALFLLAGTSLSDRLSAMQLFESGHVFYRHQLLDTRKGGQFDTVLSEVLSVSGEFSDLILTGTLKAPKFGPDFPAHHLTTRMAWADLVLDPNTLDQVLDIKTWIDHGNYVMQDLGLETKLKPGYRSLFYGPPGTGKTLTATLLGAVTAHDVYRIDLSMIVSKYIGETEKNLETVFRQAEHKDWILFFDEADALFGRRTAIASSHDRFANQEVSYLLQRIEEFPGIVILASNQKANIDEAFSRRFQSIIHFPMPRPAERRRLWQTGFSAQLPLADPALSDQLAAKYELSGGTIMNVVRYASVMAVKKQLTAVAAEDVLTGIRREYQKEGKAFG